MWEIERSAIGASCYFLGFEAGSVFLMEIMPNLVVAPSLALNTQLVLLLFDSMRYTVILKDTIPTLPVFIFSIIGKRPNILSPPTHHNFSSFLNPIERIMDLLLLLSS